MSDRVSSLPQTATENRMPPADSKERAQQFVMDLQDEICQGLEEIDGQAKFQEDSWEREGGGGGRTRVIRDGGVFEQGGVNFSAVWGDTLPPSILAQRPEAAGHGYFATGTSMVLHPRNPYVPTVHLNYRYFEAGPIWWFGGGIDLTPYYPFTEDVVHFHKTIQQACNAHHPEYYNAFKRWCDEYFYLKHRQEPRGVGGIFFDYQDYRGQLYCGQNTEGEAAQYGQQVGFVDRNWEDLFAFLQSCGRSFLPSYLPIIEGRNGMEYGERERNFQLYRRGRYVEFNLVYDRGTIFGLQTNGRTESILMSLPPLTRWQYSYQPEPGSPEAALTEVFLKPNDWANWQEPRKMAKGEQARNLRFKFHHELEQMYHRCFDELTEAGLSDREMSALAQSLLRSRQEAFKPLLGVEEMDEYQKRYPNEAP